MKTLSLALALLVAAYGAAGARGVHGGIASGAAPSSYSGPGDVQTFAMWWGTYAYSSATRGTAALNVCNVADVACADVNSDATTGLVPTPTIGGVTCGTTVGVNLCTIKTWYDQTGGGFTQTQNTIGSRATFVPTCSGLTGVACGNATGASYTTAGTYTRSQPFSAAWVANRNTSTSTNTDIMGASGIELGAGFFGANNDAICYAGSGGLDETTNAADGSWHAVSCDVNGASSNIKVDTATVKSGNAGTTTFSATMKFFDSGLSRPWKGSVASGGVASADFSTTDLANINATAHTILGF